MDLIPYDVLAACGNSIIPVIAEWPSSAGNIQGFSYRPGQLTNRVNVVLQRNEFRQNLKVIGVRQILFATYRAQYIEIDKSRGFIQIRDKNDATVTSVVTTPTPYHIVLPRYFFARDEEDREFWLLYTCTLRSYLVNHQSFAQQWLATQEKHNAWLNLSSVEALDNLLLAPIHSMAVSTLLKSPYTYEDMRDVLLMRLQRNCALVESGYSSTAELLPMIFEVLTWSFIINDPFTSSCLEDPILAPVTIARSHMAWCLLVLKREFGCQYSPSMFQRFMKSVDPAAYLSHCNCFLGSCQPP